MSVRSTASRASAGCASMSVTGSLNSPRILCIKTLENAIRCAPCALLPAPGTATPPSAASIATPQGAADDAGNDHQQDDRQENESERVPKIEEEKPHCARTHRNEDKYQYEPAEAERTLLPLGSCPGWHCLPLVVLSAGVWVEARPRCDLGVIIGVVPLFVCIGVAVRIILVLGRSLLLSR